MLVTLVAGGVWLNQQVASVHAWLDEAVDRSARISIERGQSISTVLGELSDRDDVPDLRLMRRLAPELMAIQAGTFDIQPQMSRRDVLAKMVAGDTVVEFFTLVPGQHIYQLQSQLRSDDRLVQTLPDDLNQWGPLLGFEGWPEGRFLPDTYGFSPGDRDVDILLRAAEALMRCWTVRGQPEPRGYR